MQRFFFWANLALFFVLLVLIGLALDGGGDPAQAAAQPSSEKAAVAPPRSPKGRIRLLGFPDWKRKVVVEEGGMLKLETWPMGLGLRFEGVERVFPFHLQLLDERGNKTKVSLRTDKLNLDGVQFHLDGLRPVGKRYLLRGSLGGRSFEFALEGPDPALKSARIFARGKKGESGYGVRLAFNAPLALKELRPKVRVESLAGEQLPFTLQAEVGNWELAVDRIAVLQLEADPRKFVDSSGVARLRLRIQKGLHLPGRKQPTSKTLARDLVLGGPIRLAWIRGDASCLTLHFGQPIMGVDPRQIGIAPKLPFEVETSDGGLRLRAKFQAGRVYHLRLAKGFPGHGAFRLEQAETRSFRVPDLPPSGGFVGSGSLLSGAALPELRVTGVNLSGLRLELRKMLPGNALGFFREFPGSWVDRRYLGEPRSRSFVVSAPPNERFRMRLDLSSLLDEDRVGIYQLRLYTTPREGRESVWPSTRLLQITRLGAQVRMGGGKLVARVHRLEDAAAVEGALLRVLSAKNQVLAYGTSGPDGICSLDWVRGPGRSPRVLELRKGGDRCFLDLRKLSVELSGPAFSGERAFLDEGRVEAFAWTDQGIVRPGREVRALFLVRNDQGRAPMGESLRLRWLRPGGRIYRERELLVPADGMLRAALELPSFAESGPWGVELYKGKRWLGGTRFAVKAFVPDRIEARAAFEGVLTLGKTATLRVGARWLDGGAAAGLRVRAMFFLRRGSRKLTYGGKEWVLGTPDSGAPRYPKLEAMAGGLGKDGTLRLGLGLPPIFEQGKDLGSWAQLGVLAQVEVLDPSGRPVRHWVHATAKAPKRLLLRREKGGAVRGLLLDPRDQPLAGKLALRLERRWWRSEFWVDENGTGRSRYRLQREVLREARLDLGPTGARWALPTGEAVSPAAKGWLVLVAETPGAYSELALSESRKPGAELKVLVAKGVKRPGEKVELRIKSPVAGKGLLTFEDRRVRAAREVALEEGWNQLEVSLPDVPVVPNLYVVVGIPAPQRGRLLGPYSWTGGARVPLERKERTLEPELKLAKEVRPGARVRVRVRAEGARRAFVALVDQGVLHVTGHRDPDPKGFFLGARRLGTRGADSNLALMEGVRFPREHATGGGLGGRRSLGTGPMVGTISPWIQPLALASGLLEAKPGEEGGVFDTSFRLPRDYEGRLRVFVVVAGPKATGATSRDLWVRAPLSLRLAGPRRLSPGDRCELSLVLRNQTGKAGVLKLEMKARGGLELLGQLPKSLAMKAGEQKVLWVQVLAKEGSARSDPKRPAELEVRARMGREERRSSLRLDLRPGLFPTRRILGLSLDRGRRVVPIPEGFAPGPKVLRIRVGGNPLERLRPAFRSLQGYPYGCSEQTASKARILLALGASLGSSEGKGRGPINLREKILFALDRLQAMTRGYRGLGFWGAFAVHPIPTLHSLELGLDAESQGMGQMPRSWRGILGRLGYDSWDKGDQAMKAWTLFVLQKGHVPMRRALEDKLLPRLKDPYALCWAALALEGLGEEARALEVLQGLQLDSFAQEGNYLSPLVGQALLLRALHRLAPSDPRVPTLVDRLGRACQQPRSLTTFEMSNALCALAAFQSGRFGKAAELGVRLHLGSETRVLQDGEEVRISLAPGQEPPVLEAKGKTYALLDWQGFEKAPANGAGWEAQKLRIRRRVYPVGGKDEAAHFERGQVYEVRISWELEGSLENVCLADLLAGGMETEEGWTSLNFLPKAEQGQKAGLKRRALSFTQERRDDRVLFFIDRRMEAGSYELRYRLRAVSKGRFFQAPPRLEALYQPGRHFYGKTVPWVEVR